LNFSQTTVSWTSVRYKACEEKPQSAAAMTFSRPTSLGEAQDALGDQLRMLDDIAGMGDHARAKHLAVRDFDGFEQMIFVLMARIWRLRNCRSRH